MENLMISTMPIKPYNKINPGLMIAPVICDVIGDILKCKKVLALNLLHSYDDKSVDLDKYLSKIVEFDINYNELIKDINYTDIYLSKIEQLIYMGFIEIKKGIVLRCDCGKVEIEKKSVINNKNGNLYHWENNKMICSCCNRECKEYEQTNLYMKVDSNFVNDISISPLFLKKELCNLLNRFSEREILISKNRQKDYFININNQRFNIDIDMLWMMFNQVEESKNQILIASNHQLYQIFISNYINNIFGEKSIHYIATPYLTNGEHLDLIKKIYSKDSCLYKKLVVLYSLKWKYKTLNWNNGIIELLNKLDDESLGVLYNHLLNINFDEQNSIQNIVNKIFSEINLNNNIKVLKRNK